MSQESRINEYSTIGILMSINSAIKQHQFTTIWEEVTLKLVTEPLTIPVHQITAVIPKQTNKKFLK